MTAAALLMLAAAVALGVSGSRSFNISSLSVPERAHSEAELECRYDADFTVLKWWKGRQEFFRYTPGATPSTRSFPALGVGAVEALACGPTACRLRLTGLTREASGAYRCDLERERPPYRFAARAAHMLVEAEGGVGEGPVLAGVRDEYGAGEAVEARCAGRAGSALRWYVNGQERERARDTGVLRVEATRLLFPGARAELVLQCAEFSADGGRLLGSNEARARWRQRAVHVQRAREAEEQRAVPGSGSAASAASALLLVLSCCGLTLA